MIARRSVLKGLLTAPAAAGLAVVATSLPGCGNEGAPMIPMEKKRSEMTRESENLPGIPVKDSGKTPKKK